MRGMNFLINYLLLIGGAVALSCACFYANTEKRRTLFNNTIVILGFFLFIWCTGYALMGMTENLSMAYVFRNVGLLGVNGFMTTEFIMLAYLSDVFGKARPYVIGIMLFLTGTDYVIYSRHSENVFYRLDGRTVYTTTMSFGRLVQFTYLSITMVMLFICGIGWLRKTIYRRERTIVYLMFVANFMIVIGAILDTVLPMLGVPSFPGSGYGSFVAYIILVQAAVKYNAFSISSQNINSYIFDYVHSPVMVFDQWHRLATLNDYGQHYLHIDKVNRQKLSDLFDISEYEGDRLLDSASGSSSAKVCRLVTKTERSICVLNISAVVDVYEDPYCTVCFAYDLSKETAMLREVNTMKEQLEDVLDEKRIEIEHLTLQSITTIANTIDAKDTYTKGHSLRVSQYSARIAEALHWEDKHIQNLRYTALLHDIGKIGIPDAILNKPNGLSEVEYQLIQSHTTTGGEILKDITMIPHVADGAMYHHERFDGQGYPSGLAGADIPLEARIICIADAYDAMNSDRIYRNALPPEVIRQEMVKERGKQFDPMLLDVFLELFDAGKMVPSTDSAASTGSLAEETSVLLGQIIRNMEMGKENEASIDLMTGLLERADGEKKIAIAMKEEPGCLAFIDLDNLKHVNDIMGHASGDAAIRIVGEVLNEHAHTAIISRIGGDEFLFYMPGADEEEAGVIIDGIIHSYRRRKEEDPALESTSLSVGLCTCTPADTFTEVFQKADKALYHTKQTGKGGVTYYSELDAKLSPANTIDLNRLIQTIQASGSYSGALSVEYREFAKMYDFLTHLSARYDHSMRFLVLNVNPLEGHELSLNRQEQAMDVLEKSIMSTLRNVDICTRFTNVQYLVVLFNPDEENMDLILHRIFESFHKNYPRKDVTLTYDLADMDKIGNA